MNRNSLYDSLEDFKAAFISVNESSKGFLRSSSELLRALQQCGRNPNKKIVEKYWNQNNYIDIDEFCEIASREKNTTEDDLITAFRMIDSGSDGLIRLEEFIDIFGNEGDELHKDEIRQLLKEADIDKNKELNYKEFVDLVMNTIAKAKKNANKKMKMITQKEKDAKFSARDERSFSPLSLDDYENEIEYKNEKKKMKNMVKPNDRRHVENDFAGEKNSKMENEFEFRINENLVNEKKLLFPKNYKKWFSKSTKGGFYFNQNINGIIANSFALDLKHKSTLFFTIEEFKTEIHSIYELGNMDVSLLVIKDDEILSVESLTETKIENKCSAKVDLAPGRYFLFPFTTGCHLKKRQSEYTRTKVELFKQDLKGKTSLSRKFRDALDVVFDLVDLDSNGKLSQDEFNLYSFITSNEDIPDKEWKFLGELVGLKKNELTKESFIELHVIEANREDKDLNDIMSRLTNLGFNKSLTIDQSCSFVINIYSEKSDFQILLSEIYEIRTSEAFLKQILASKSISHSIKDAPNVNLLIYHNDFWSAILIQNNSKEYYKLEINCSKSENCISNTNDLIRIIQVKPNKIKIAMFLTKFNPEKELKIRCKPSIIN